MFKCNSWLYGGSDLISGIIILLCGKCGINNPPCSCPLPSFTNKLSMYYLLWQTGLLSIAEDKIKHWYFSHLSIFPNFSTEFATEFAFQSEMHNCWHCTFSLENQWNWIFPSKIKFIIVDTVALYIVNHQRITERWADIF